jgi:hypothetical protein
MAQKLQLRRGLEAQRTSITPDVGEPLFTTDNKQFFLGDGATAGGVLIGGGAVASVLKYRGTQAIAAGADSVAVSGLTLPSVPAQVLVTMRKVTGGLNLFAVVRSDSITSAGFTVDLSAATDAATYQLDYLVVL